MSNVDDDPKYSHLRFSDWKRQVPVDITTCANNSQLALRKQPKARDVPGNSPPPLRTHKGAGGAGETGRRVGRTNRPKVSFLVSPAPST